MGTARGPTTPRWSLIFAVVVVMGVASSFAAVSAGAALGPVGSANSPLEVGGITVLAQAESSLAHGDGPAAGTSLACSAESTANVECGSSSLATPASATAGYSWANISSRSSTAPSQRLTVMTWDAGDGYVLLIGGETWLSTFPSDTWTFSNGTWTNITAETTGAPPGLVWSGLAYDPSTGKVVLFGGVEASISSETNYTWTYHAKVWTNLTSSLHTAPSPRAFPGITTDSTDGDLLLVGGDGTAGFLSDTWTFKNGVWTNITSTEATHLPLVYYPVLSDYPGHGALLWASYSSSGLITTGTWVFTGEQWTNITSTLTFLPSAPLTCAAAYVPSLSGVVGFCGAFILPDGGGEIGDYAWLFSGGSWTNITNLIGTVYDAYAVEYGAAAYVPTDQSIITFGGLRVTPPPYENYTWALSTAPTVTAHASKTVVDAGQPVTFSGTISGGLEPNTPAWSFGDGTTSPSLSPSHTFATAGLYTATLKVTDLLGGNGSASVSVLVNAAPSVSIGSSGSPTAGAPVGLAATVAGGTAPFTYAWVLGDNSTGASAFLSHTYANAGTYVVNVTVTDSVGAVATSTVSLVVAAAPASSSSSVSLTSGTGLYLLIGIIVLLLVVVLLAVLLMRKPKSPSGAPAPYAGPTYAPPPPVAGPPPGATGPPPPPPGGS